MNNPRKLLRSLLLFLSPLLPLAFRPFQFSNPSAHFRQLMNELLFYPIVFFHAIFLTNKAEFRAIVMAYSFATLSDYIGVSFLPEQSTKELQSGQNEWECEVLISISLQNHDQSRNKNTSICRAYSK